MKRIVLLAAICLMSADVQAAERPALQPFSAARDMSTACGFVAAINSEHRQPARQDAYALLCLGYMHGWVASAAQADGKTCIPPDVSDEQIIALFQAAVAQAPAGGSLATAGVLDAALRQAYPCRTK